MKRIVVRQKKPAKGKRYQPRQALPKHVVPDSCRKLGFFVPGFHDY